MLIFIFYCFITMSATSRTEDRNEAGTCSSTKDEKKGTEVKKRTFPRKGNSKGQIDKEPKEVQNESENNSSKSKYGRTENKITVLQNHNNNSNDKNRAKQKKQKKRKDKKETSHRENDTAQLPFRQVPAEVNKLEAEKFIEDLRKLEEDGVYPLKKKSMRFSRAKFFCRLCEYHCDTLTISQKHILENRHSTLKETKLLERTLHALLPPLQAQYEALTEVVENIFAEVGITDEEIEQRFEIKAELEQELQEIVKDGTLNVTGSTLSRFALRSSNLDLDVESPGTKVSAGILAIKKIIDTKNDKYIDPVNDLSSSYPCLSFTHKKHGVRVVVGIYSPTSRHLNRMLGYYSFIDRRVKVLVTAFKHWAKICKIDNHREGSLAAHCFPLMVVHFLQQVSPPVVPVLHELFEERDPEYLLTPDDLSLWKSQNVQSVGELWLNLVKFYALDFKTSINVINIRCTEPFVRKESKWGKKMAIEDPFQPKRNQTYTVSCYLVFEYITNAIRNTYRYFAIPQMSYGPLFKQMEDTCGPLYKAISGNRYNSEDDIEKSWWNIDALADDEDEEEQEEDMGVEFLDEDEEYVERIGTSISKSDLTDDVINLEESINHMAISTEVSEEGTNEASALPLENAQKKPSRTFNIGELKGTLKTILKEEAVSLLAQIEKDMLNYSFQINFTGGKKLPLFCTSCQQNGHTKYSCVDDELPPLKPLPHLRRSYLETLSHLFYQLKNECAPKPEEIRHRDFIVSELQRYIQEFFPKAVLKLFGSSANGFGFGNSDLDICFTFTDRPTGEDIDHITIIEEIAKRLKRFRECRNVLAITTAKVPIVKFFLYRAQLEADLSLYNTLALQNTQLLSTYTEIDHRVKILGYTLKYFAKLCDIGDASRGSLSSYAYILMVLHFLQQCKPAVIPVLQELYDHSKTQPEHVIDGWNAWFYDDVETLSKVWKDYGKNREGVGDLWVKLLRYYTEEFNWKDNVISIRQIEPLSKLEKLWTTKCIAIEDPFDLSHNLGTGLSRKMNAYIMTSFIKGREVFGFGLERPPHGYPSIGAYLFDKRLLTDGAPPNDRGCRWCGRIGHIVKECPRKQQQKDKQRGSKDTAKKNNEKPRTHNEDKAIPIPVPAPTTEATPGKPSKTSSVQNSREKDHSHNKSVQNTKGSPLFINISPTEIPGPSGINKTHPRVNSTFAGVNNTSIDMEVTDISTDDNSTPILKMFPVVLKGLCFPLEIFDSILNCQVCCDLFLNLRFKVIPLEMFNSFLKSVTGLIVIEFSVQLGKNRLMIIYDKYKCLSSEQERAYFKQMSVTNQKIRKFVENFSFVKDRSLRILEIFRFHQQVDNLLDDMGLVDSSVKKLIKKEKAKMFKKSNQVKSKSSAKANQQTKKADVGKKSEKDNKANKSKQKAKGKNQVVISSPLAVQKAPVRNFNVPDVGSFKVKNSEFNDMIPVPAPPSHSVPISVLSLKQQAARTSTADIDHQVKQRTPKKKAMVFYKTKVPLEASSASKSSSKKTKKAGKKKLNATASTPNNQI